MHEAVIHVEALVAVSCMDGGPLSSLFTNFGLFFENQKPKGVVLESSGSPSDILR